MGVIRSSGTQVRPASDAADGKQAEAATLPRNQDTKDELE
jgi:hypothetical protein